MLKSIPLVIRLREHDLRKADLAKALHIDRHRLDYELSHQPGNYAWWAALAAQASERVEDLKHRLGRLEARLTFECKKEFKGAKANEIKNYIRLSKRYRKLNDRIREWRSAESILEHAVKAFEQRKDVLMAINANTRKEKEHSRE